MIIGVSGHARVGKDTLADRLVSFHGFTKMAFADPLKEFCGQIFGFTHEQLYGGERELIDPRWGFSARVALQTLGTEWGRHLHPDVWVRYGLRRAAANASHTVITDVRFASEVHAVKAAGGHVVRVRRPGAVGAVGIAGHASEAEQDGIPDSAFDWVIENTGTLAEFCAKVDTLGVWGVQ